LKAKPVLPILGARRVRLLQVAALSLTLAALLIALQFVLKTTGGTLFLFTMAAPPLVLFSIAILLICSIDEYRQTHRLFDVECHEAGQTVFSQGDQGNCAYFIRRGEVEVVDEQQGTVVATLGPGEFFGEMALISNAARNATVRTVSSAELAVLGKRNFLNMMRLLPETEEAILTTVRQRAVSREAPRQP
jgi:CRP-like cAMP-binding protein